MSRRRYILITAAVIATGLGAWTHLHRRNEYGRNGEYRLAPLTPDQLERARRAMDDLDLWGDAGTYGRQP